MAQSWRNAPGPARIDLSVEIGVAALETSLSKTLTWLKELRVRLSWESRETAYSGLRAVLQALRDRLLVDEAFDLVAELPLVLRGTFLEGWDRNACPTRERTKEDFLARVSGRLVAGRNVDPEALTRAVFEILVRHVSGGEIAHVIAMLPEPIRDLWPSREPAAAPAATSSKRGGEPSRAVLRRAKKRIAEVLAQARAEGASPRDLPLMVSRRDAKSKARRRRA